MKKSVGFLVFAIFTLTTLYSTVYATTENHLANEITNDVAQEVPETQENQEENTMEKDNITTETNSVEPEITIQPDQNEAPQETTLPEEIISEQPELPESEEKTVPEELPETVQPEEPIIEQVQTSPENPTGKMYIESFPVLTYSLADSSTMSLFGWAVSDDYQAQLVAQIDGKEVPVQVTRGSRPDVDGLVSPNYGGTKATPKAGFFVEIDITKLSEGKHIVKLSQVGKNNKVICSDTRELQILSPNHTGKMYVESFPLLTYSLPQNETMSLFGWAVSDDKEAQLIVKINEKEVPAKITRGRRPDVDGLVSPDYGGTEATPKAGFLAEVDIRDMVEGHYQVEILQMSRYGKVLCSDTRELKIITPDYTGKMYIESFPVLTYTLPTNTNMNLFGWAVADDSNASFVLKIDDKEVPCDIIRGSRPDVDSAVSPDYGGTEATPKAGFFLTADITELTEGEHEVELLQMSRYQKVLSSSTRKLKIVTPEYTGKMYVESPIRNKRYPSGWLDIRGWAITEENGDYVKIYLDGTYQTIAEGIQRPDVLAAHGKSYPKHHEYVGFYSRISIAGLPEGLHTVKIEHYSKYNKKIQQIEVNFLISNTLTAGIDVSHHNGTINWDAVRDSGINFAILKIGEYRETSKRILMDAHFEEYYNACKARGIAVGGYFYSYAFDPTEAAHEADACTAIIRGKSFELPIFFDIEDKIVTNAVDKNQTNVTNLTNAAMTFCNIMNTRGYQSGIYSYKNFFENYLDMSSLEKYNIWLAHYVSDTNYSGKYDLWQHTSSGKVPGITGNVDLNWCYKRY